MAANTYDPNYQPGSTETDAMGREAGPYSAPKYQAPGERLSISTPIYNGMRLGEAKGKELFGQGTEQTGADLQDIISRRKANLNQTDPTSTLIKQSSSNQMRAAKMSGLNLSKEQQMQERRKTDTASQASLYKQGQESLNQYQNLMGKVAAQQQQMSLGYASLAVGQAAPSAPASSGLTVICTELNRQGYLSEELYKADVLHGDYVRRNAPDVYAGYAFLAAPVVKCMQKSTIFTKFVSILALPWAKWMYDGKQPIGALVNWIGVPICYWAGILFCRRALCLR
jgi:hypothetical protein